MSRRRGPELDLISLSLSLASSSVGCNTSPACPMILRVISQHCLIESTVMLKVVLTLCSIPFIYSNASLHLFIYYICNSSVFLMYFRFAMTHV